MVLTWNTHKFSPVWGHFHLVIVKASSRDHCSATVQHAGPAPRTASLTKDDSSRTLALAAKAVGLAARGDLGDFYNAYVLGALKSLRRLQVRCLASTSCLISMREGCEDILSWLCSERC